MSRQIYRTHIEKSISVAKNNAQIHLSAIYKSERTRRSVKERYNFVQIYTRAICMRNELRQMSGKRTFTVSQCMLREIVWREFVIKQYRTQYPRTTIYFDRCGIGSLQNDTSARYNIDFIGPPWHIPVFWPKCFPSGTEWNDPYKRDRIRKASIHRSRKGKRKQTRGKRGYAEIVLLY